MIDDDDDKGGGVKILTMSLFIANWKMHGGAAFCRQWAREWARAIADNDGGNDNGGGDDDKHCKHSAIVVCPPLAYIGILREQLSAAGVADIHIGAQDISRFDDAGAYTGEISAKMAADCGCRYAIIGHSERRQLFDEDNAIIAAKLRAAIAAGLSPVLCIGESERQKQQTQTAAVIHQQLSVIDNIADDGMRRLIIAYEPVWAIGSGRTPEVADIAEAQKIIRQKLIAKSGKFGGRIAIVYGGSVRADNVAGLLAGGGVDGALVGGASLSAAGFVAITSVP